MASDRGDRSEDRHVRSHQVVRSIIRYGKGKFIDVEFAWLPDVSGPTLHYYIKGYEAG